MLQPILIIEVCDATADRAKTKISAARIAYLKILSITYPNNASIRVSFCTV